MEKVRVDKLTFLCSEAVLGLSGVEFMLAGVAATGEEDDFSIMSAGIFTVKSIIPQNAAKYGPPMQKGSGRGKKKKSRVSAPSLNPRGATCRCECVSACVGASACGVYLYLAPHANGSCETSQTFFPTLTSHQSGRGARGPGEDGSWSAPSHWLRGGSQLAANGAPPGLRAQPGNCLPVFNHHTAGTRTGAGASGEAPFSSRSAKINNQGTRPLYARTHAASYPALTLENMPPRSTKVDVYLTFIKGFKIYTCNAGCFISHTEKWSFVQIANYFSCSIFKTLKSCLLSNSSERNNRNVNRYLIGNKKICKSNIHSTFLICFQNRKLVVHFTQTPLDH